MSRREEVKTEMVEWASDGDGVVQMACLRNRCRTLAGEVDERDAIIDKLLAMLEPGDPPCDCISEDGPDAACCGYNIGDWGRAVAWVESKALHARACEIAGRKSNACKRCAGTGITERLVSPRYRQNEVCGTCNGTGRKE